MPRKQIPFITSPKEQFMYERAASLISEAEVFVITAGAGMGVDSGLPDFRGEHGFWKAYSWLQDRTLAQNHAFDKFMGNNTGRNIVIIELGAGKAIPTIRHISERIGERHKNATVIRINPREPGIKSPHISIRCGALAGLQHLENLLQ
jgi:hypothetical protein